MGIATSLCAGRAAGDVIEDNPLARTGTFRDGSLQSFGYSARGGGANYGYFVSLGLDEEDGTLSSNISAGVQVINEVFDRVTGNGTGFVTNTNRRGVAGDLRSAAIRHHRADRLGGGRDPAQPRQLRPEADLQQVVAPGAAPAT